MCPLSIITDHPACFWIKRLICRVLHQQIVVRRKRKWYPARIPPPSYFTLEASAKRLCWHSKTWSLKSMSKFRPDTEMQHFRSVPEAVKRAAPKKNTRAHFLTRQLQYSVWSVRQEVRSRVKTADLVNFQYNIQCQFFWSESATTWRFHFRKTLYKKYIYIIH